VTAGSSSMTRIDARDGCKGAITRELSVTLPLRRAELSITGVAQPRHDVANVVEPLVNRGDVDRHVGMTSAQPLDAFWRGEQPDVLDAFDAPALQDVDARLGGPAGGQHRVEHDRELDAIRRRQ